jgi:hypothetical protein
MFEGSRLDLGFALQVLSSRPEALIWVLSLQGFWSTIWIRGTCVDLFQESSRLKQKIELVQGSTQIRIGTLRERTDVLPSAPGKSASRQLLTKMKDFIHRENQYKRGADCS